MRYTCNTCGAVYLEPHQQCPNCGEQLVQSDYSPNINKDIHQNNYNQGYNNYNQGYNNYVPSENKEHSIGKIILISILSIVGLIILTIGVITMMVFINLSEINDYEDDYVYSEEYEDYEDYGDNDGTYTVEDYETPYYMVNYKTGEYDFFDCIVTGTLEYGNLEGYGKVVNIEEGYTYEGEFFSGNFDGIGVLTFDNGEKIQAQFRYGQIEENLTTAILTIYQDEGIYLPYETQTFLEYNSEELKSEEGLPDYYYDLERVSLRELNDTPYNYIGECMSLPELKLMEVSTREVYADGYKVTEFVGLDKQDNAYKLITANEKTGLNVGDIIKPDVMFVSPIQIYGSVDANLFVMLNYEMN